MKCLKCGYSLPEDSEFCQYCGAKLETETDGDSALSVERGAVAEEVIAESTAVELGAPEASKRSADDNANILQSDKEDIARESTDDVSQTETVPVDQDIANLQVQEGAAVSQSDIPENSTQLVKKQKYCKCCGGAIHLETKKCQGCGKQYFRVPKHLGVWILAAICLALVGLNVFQYTQVSSAEEKLQQAVATISANEKTISGQKKTIAEKSAEISNLKQDVTRYKEWWIEDFDKAMFLDDYVVIIGDSNNKYHKFGCEDLDLSNFYAYNIDNAKAQGYRACTKCN